MSKDKKRVDPDLNKCKNDFLYEKKVRKLIQEVTRLKMDLEKEKKWTKSSRIVNKLSKRTHNEKIGLGINKETGITRNMCYICGNLGHLTTECAVAENSSIRITNMVNGIGFMIVQTNKNSSEIV